MFDQVKVSASYDYVLNLGEKLTFERSLFIKRNGVTKVMTGLAFYLYCIWCEGKIHHVWGSDFQPAATTRFQELRGKDTQNLDVSAVHFYPRQKRNFDEDGRHALLFPTFLVYERCFHKRRLVPRPTRCVSIPEYQLNAMSHWLDEHQTHQSCSHW